ncbi:MAG: helix-turn-helix transcriptional regulator [Desulfobacterales bacterium]
MNRLEAFFKKTGKKQSEIANAAGCSKAAISMIAKGRRRPSPDLALRIERATGGAVRAAELIFSGICEQDAA